MPKKTFLAVLFIAQILLFFSIVKVFADSTPPVTTHMQNPAVPNGNNGWYVSPVQFQLNATDLESGVKEINYRIDGGPWMKEEFSDSLNLAPNPSFEIGGPAPSNIKDWGATIVDGSGSYTRDTGEYYPGFFTSSARITATQGPWHGINNQSEFSAAMPFGNMSASVWVKTQNITGTAYFKIYVVSQDGTGAPTYIEAGQSNTVTGTNDWTLLSLNFIANDINTIGVYIDLGLNSNGILWADAVSISESLTSASTSVTISSEGSGHTLEYYSVDVAENAEAFSCPTVNCPNVSIDLIPPGSWYDSGAVRGAGGSSHELYVYTNVLDFVSGISTNTNKYMYSVENESGFGYYEDLLHCNTPWHQNEWVSLLTYPAVDGLNDVSLMTQKTDFCNSNWKICKTVRFYVEDVAGNTNTKDFCINGPWIKFRGEGIVRSNENIDMLAEPIEDNTDGLIEIGGIFVDFFTSSKNWVVRNSPVPKEYTYNTYLAMAGSTTPLTTDLVAASGVYEIDGDFEIKSSSIPGNYSNATFNQVVFVNGDLRISNNITIDDASAALFIVSGNVEIDEKVEDVYIAIFADGNIHTAYNLDEGKATKTIEFRGIYSANRFDFERTLQGTGNQNDPSDSFTFEPKYLIQIRDYFGKNNIIWKSIE